MTDIPAIQTERASRHHQLGTSTIRALDEVSLTVPKGEFASLLGPSGSGKSTLLNLVAGLDRPTSGAINVLGKDLAKMTSEELAIYRRLTVGMVFQSFNLIPTMTVAENVELPLRFAETPRDGRAARVKEALDRVELGRRAGHRPSELSGGEQQRCSIARALINHPSLLLADEPTGNLDSRTGTEIMTVLDRLNREMGMTILMVTHERAIAEKWSQRMIFMADGQLVSEERTGRQA
jgi:putative ABC transport system ATP-binding protein